MEKLTAAELNELKQQLIQRNLEILQLEKAHEKEALESIQVSNERVVMADVGNDETVRDVNFILAEHEIQELLQIDSAISRINNGNYGTCHECGDPITFKRLRAIPYTAFCISCEEELEAENSKKVNHNHKNVELGFREPKIGRPLK